MALLILLATLLVYDSLFPPVSTLMLARWLTARKVERQAVTLDRIAPALIAAVISSEDARFCRHWGVDWGEMRIATRETLDGVASRGASTIDMQVVKNLFLTPQRLFLRKALEIPLTLALNVIWPKKKILSAYLNVAEWGDGVFGAQAAARLYFHKSAEALTPREAALLAAALPNPRQRDPRHPTYAQGRKAQTIMGRMARGGARLDCVPR